MCFAGGHRSVCAERYLPRDLPDCTTLQEPCIPALLRGRSDERPDMRSQPRPGNCVLTNLRKSASSSQPSKQILGQTKGHKCGLTLPRPENHDKVAITASCCVQLRMQHARIRILLQGSISLQTQTSRHKT